MTPDRKKPGLAFWATMVVVVFLVYPLSFGPACWITSHVRVGSKAVPSLYAPIIWGWNHGGPALASPLHWYSCLFADDNWEWVLDGVDGKESAWVDLSVD